MSLKDDLAAALAADARLVMLRELAAQVNGRLSDVLLQRTLDAYGIARDGDWIRTQLNKLDMLGAISLREAGDMVIARIEPAGRDHLEERAVLEGVTPPSKARIK